MEDHSPEHTRMRRFIALTAIFVLSSLWIILLIGGIMAIEGPPRIMFIGVGLLCGAVGFPLLKIMYDLMIKH